MFCNDQPPAHEIRELLRGLPLVKAPDSVWNSIEASLKRPARERRGIAPRFIWVAAAMLVLAIGGAAYLYIVQGSKARWSVVRNGGTGFIRAGEWLQTDAGSTARISIGDFGVVDVEPNTRVRMESSQANEQRLQLARGEIRATVTAPPRLFLVDTPASTAVDLGCSYSMKTDKEGTGLLHVVLGWVSLEWAGRESLVPAGAMCRTRPKIGPGTPYFDDASARLSEALTRFDFESGGAGALDIVLGEARVRDTLTLWHLLSRTEGGGRVRVYDRMVALTPAPGGISRENALRLDAETLKRWKEELAWRW